jgi:hypothetical protein
MRNTSVVKVWSKTYPTLGEVEFTLLRVLSLRGLPINGYVTYRLRRFDVDYDDLDVHGGITYATDMSAEQLRNGELVEVTDSPWRTIGFDTSHAGDDTDPRTKDINGYLTEQCESVADQLERMVSAPVRSSR